MLTSACEVPSCTHEEPSLNYKKMDKPKQSMTDKIVYIDMKVMVTMKEWFGLTYPPSKKKGHNEES